MRSQKAAPPRPRQRSGARGNASMLDRSSSIAKPSSRPQQAALLRAELTGDTYTAAGITACGHVPVLALCRELITAGFSPEAPLEAWRGSISCLRIRSIGQAAKLTVRSAGNGCPVFAWKHSAEGAGASPVRKNMPRVVPPGVSDSDAQ